MASGIAAALRVWRSPHCPFAKARAMADRSRHARNRLYRKRPRRLRRRRPRSRPRSAIRASGCRSTRRACRLRLLRQALHPEGRPGGRLSVTRRSRPAARRDIPRSGATSPPRPSPAAASSGKKRASSTSTPSGLRRAWRHGAMNRWIVSRLPSALRLVDRTAASTPLRADPGLLAHLAHRCVGR